MVRSDGMSLQGAHMRGRQKMPFRTRRRSTRSLPRTTVGDSGSITAHSASIRSNCAVGALLLGFLRALRFNRASQYGFAT